MHRRTVVLAAGAAGAVAGLGSAIALSDTPRRIALSARKFSFSVAEIRIVRGETVILELRSEDFVHGFAIPELSLRADVPPGRTTELSVRADRIGRFVFLCDNFCGDAHDKMSGWLVVASG